MNIKQLFEEGSALYVDGEFAKSSEKIRQGFDLFFGGYFDNVFQCQVPEKEKSSENMTKIQKIQALYLELAFLRKNKKTIEEVEEEINNFEL